MRVGSFWKLTPRITEERQVEVKMFLFRAGSRIGEHSFVQAVPRHTHWVDVTFPIQDDVGVSINGGIPKWMVYSLQFTMEKTIIKHVRCKPHV